MNRVAIREESAFFCPPPIRSVEQASQVEMARFLERYWAAPERRFDHPPYGGERDDLADDEADDYEDQG